MYSTRKAAFLIFLVLLYLFFRGIGDHGLLDPLEGVNASIALGMAARNNFSVPMLENAPYWGTSMGFWWLSAVTLRWFFGWIEFSVRFWPALGGLGMAAASWFIARRSGGGRAANYAAVLTGTSLLTYGVSQISSHHALYACLVTMALAGALYGFQNRRFFLLLHVSSVLALIVHGPAGLILPWLSLMLYAYLAEQEKFFLSAMFYWPGTLATALLGGGYLCLCFFENPALLTMMRYNPPAVAFSSLSESCLFLAAGFFPWVAIPFVTLKKTLPADWEVIQPEERQNVLLLVWTAVFLFFGFFVGDALLLAVPLPALMSLCALHLADAVEKRDSALFRKMIVIKFFLFMTFLCAGLPLIYANNPNMSGTLMSVMPWAVLCLVFLGVGWYYAKTRQPHKLMRHLCNVALISLLPLAGAFDLLSENLAVRDIGLYLRGELKRDGLLVQHSMNIPSLYYYTAKDSLLVNAPAMPRTKGREALSESALNRMWGNTSRIVMVIRRDQNEYLSRPQEIHDLYQTPDFVILSNRRRSSGSGESERPERIMQ